LHYIFRSTLVIIRCLKLLVETALPPFCDSNIRCVVPSTRSRTPWWLFLLCCVSRLRVSWSRHTTQQHHGIHESVVGNIHPSIHPSVRPSVHPSMLLPLGVQANRETLILLQFPNLRQSVGLLGQVISPSQVAAYTETQNKRRQISMSWVVFEPTIPVFERAKTFHVLDRAATVIGVVGTTHRILEPENWRTAVPTNNCKRLMITSFARNT
jgi:hypothetical protein